MLTIGKKIQEQKATFSKERLKKKIQECQDEIKHQKSLLSSLMLECEVAGHIPVNNNKHSICFICGKHLDAKVKADMENPAHLLEIAKYILADMWEQFAAPGYKDGIDTLWSGGLSALEWTENFLKQVGIINESGRIQQDYIHFTPTYYLEDNCAGDIEVEEA